MDKCILKYNMWQQQQAYLRGSSSQYPQQQAVHPVAIISPDNRAHQQHHQHHHQHYQHHQQHRAAVMDLPMPRSDQLSYYDIRITEYIKVNDDMRARDIVV